MDESERTEGEPEAAHEPPKAANEGGATPPPPQSPGGARIPSVIGSTCAITTAPPSVTDRAPPSARASASLPFSLVCARSPAAALAASLSARASSTAP